MLYNNVQGYTVDAVEVHVAGTLGVHDGALLLSMSPSGWRLPDRAIAPGGETFLCV